MLAHRGTDLVVVARRRDRLEQLAADLQLEHGREVELLEADLTDPAQLARVEARLADEDRPVDLLVNNAGFGTQGLFVDLPIEGEDQEIRLNVVAVVRLTRAALPGMVARGHGAVLNVSSIASLQPLPGWATYSASKSFVTTFSKALGAELHGTGVQVTVLLPGFTHTEFHEGMGFSRSLIPGPAWMTAEEVVEAGLEGLDRGRVQTIPGIQNKALATASRLSPWAVTRRVLHLATRRMR